MQQTEDLANFHVDPSLCDMTLIHYFSACLGLLIVLLTAENDSR